LKARALRLLRISPRLLRVVFSSPFFSRFIEVLIFRFFEFFYFFIARRPILKWANEWTNVISGWPRGQTIAKKTIFSRF